MGIYHNQSLTLASSVPQRNALNIRWGQTFPAWFQTFPPERVGPNGEYDHYGLKKRVEVAFNKHFPPETLAHLSVSQRGRVVILHGRVPTHTTLQNLISIAESVEGTIRVECAWVEFETDSTVAYAM